jgi:voltage-gated potassium channel
MPSAWAVLRRRLAIPLIALLVTHLVGTLGYWLLWRDLGATLFDGLFMTFTTVTTIGYGEVYPLDAAGRALTMAIAAGGIGSVFYSFSVMLDWASSDEMRANRRRRKMFDQIKQLSDHYVVAGFGRVGREASRELQASGKRVVVVDIDDDHVAAAAEVGLPYIKGDASDDEVLRATGIERARGLIVTTANDATNLYVVMTARLLVPKLFIVSRAVDSSAVPKLERAGASRAVSPHAVGGKRMAHLILSPRVVDFFETALRRGDETLSIGELQVVTGARAVGESLEALRRRSGTGATFLAVLRGPDGTVVTPADDLVLGSGDHLLALGTDDQLERLETSLGG